MIFYYLTQECSQGCSALWFDSAVDLVASTVPPSRLRLDHLLIDFQQIQQWTECFELFGLSVQSFQKCLGYSLVDCFEEDTRFIIIMMMIKILCFFIFTTTIFFAFISIFIFTFLVPVVSIFQLQTACAFIFGLISFSHLLLFFFFPSLSMPRFPVVFFFVFRVLPIFWLSHVANFRNPFSFAVIFPSELVVWSFFCLLHLHWYDSFFLSNWNCYLHWWAVPSHIQIITRQEFLSSLCLFHLTV